MCKVRVISGEVAQTQHSDYQLSENEKAQGYTLMCCNTAASSDLTLELLEASGPQDIPEQQIVTHVRAITTLAPNTRLLHLQTPRTHRLRFLAGQSVRLGWTMPGQGDVRATTATCSSILPGTRPMPWPSICSPTTSRRARPSRCWALPASLCWPMDTAPWCLPRATADLHPSKA
jgi:hypothetical protein